MITLPEETGQKHYSIVVFKGEKFKENIEEYFEWKTHKQLLNFIYQHSSDCVCVRSAAEPWIIRNLQAYGNCIIGREYPIPMQKFNLELKNFGLRVKASKTDGCIRLDVIK